METHPAQDASTKRGLLEKRLSDLGELKQQLLGTRSLDEKLKLITDATVRIFGADFARIWMVRAADLCERGCRHAAVREGPDVCRNRSRCLHLMASSGRYPRTDGSHRRVPLGCYKIGRVASGEDPWFITNDVANDPRVHDREWAKSLGLVAFAGYRLVSADGAPVGVLAFFRDRAIQPSEERLLADLANSASQVILTGMAQEALRESEARYRVMMDQAADAVFMHDETGRIRDVNQKACQSLGYTKEELLAKSIADIDPMAIQTGKDELWGRVLAGEHFTFESSQLRKDGSAIPVEVTLGPVRLPLGPAVLGIVRDITERKQAEEALRKSEQRFRLLFNSAKDAILVHGFTPGEMPGPFIEANEMACQRYGYSREELLRMRPMDLDAPEGLAAIPEAMRRLKADGFATWEGVHLAKDGRRISVEISNSVFHFLGKPLVLATARDITERKRAEKELKQSLSLLRATLESTADGILVVSASGKITDFNERFAQLWRLPETVLSSRDDQQALDFVLSQLKDPQAFLAKVQQLYAHPEADSFDVLEFKDGRVFERYSQPQRVEGRPVGRVWSFRDVSERRKAEAERNRLFNLSLDMLCIAGFDGRLKQVNPAWVKTLGWTEQELLDSPWLEFVHPEDREATIAAAERLSHGKPVMGFENRYRCRDGSYRWFSWNSFPLPEEGLMFGVIRDVTEIRRMEERLRHSEKMEAIGQLAGGVAHDFNNQLTGILGYAEMLSNQLEDETLRRYAEMIMLSAKRSAELTRQLLAFARKGKYQSVSVDIHKVIGEVAALLRHTVDRRITIKQVLQADPPVTLGDPTQIQSALLNLALNARDAMPDGGELVFATNHVVLDAEYCRSNPHEIKPGRYLQICVTDSGVGMSDEIRKHLFEPFFTTKEVGKGTGMGLAAVYGIVKGHKGVISVYSELGHGTTFKICLPLLASAEKAERAQTPPEVGEPVKGTARILVVDDEEIVLKLAADALRDLGYQVTTCKDGAEAVAYYREAWGTIDLVVLDMVMPVLGGRETFLAMRQINPAVRAILASGYSINGQAQNILDEGVLDFVQKPFQLHELSGKVAAALGRDDCASRGSADTANVG